MLKEKVQDLLEKALEENQKLFLIDLQIDSNNNITVIIDGDEGVTVSDCVFVSRAIEHNLDREMFDFALEVASAGATAPLTIPRQFKKNIGKILEIKTKEKLKFEGTLTEVTENGIQLSWTTREPKPVGKGKVTVEKSESFDFENIKESRVKIIFN